MIEPVAFIVAAHLGIAEWSVWQLFAPLRRTCRLGAFEAAARGVGLMRDVWDEPEDASVWHGEFEGGEILWEMECKTAR